MVALYYAPYLFLCAVIFVLSAKSNPPIPDYMKFKDGDKVLHALAFMGVGLAAALGAVLRRRVLSWRSFLEGWLLTVVYAFLDEVHQIYVPRRTPSSADWMADVFGATVGVSMLFVAIYAMTKSRKI